VLLCDFKNKNNFLDKKRRCNIYTPFRSIFCDYFSVFAVLLVCVVHLLVVQGTLISFVSWGFSRFRGAAAIACLHPRSCV